MLVSDGSGGSTSVPADGASEVLLSSTVTVVFNDIMNPATIANLTSGVSNTITVKIDPDGNLANPGDQVDWAGTWTVDVDFDLLRTTAVFTPSGGFPSAGDDPMNPRLTIVELPATLLDLVGNPLSNPGQHIFSTQILAFPPIVLPKDGGEDFTDSSNEDALASGGAWGGGSLVWGQGGGAGRLGPLLVRSGTEVTLNTDSQAFPLTAQVRSILDNNVPGAPGTGAGGDYDPLDSGTWPGITITDGTFEFSSVTIEPNAKLILVGSNPGRIFARGQAIHNGVIDLSGETPAPHASNSGGSHPNNVIPGTSDPRANLTRFGGAGGAGGPAGGAGGQGADRVDMTGAANPLPTNAGGMVFPVGEVPVNDGRAGEGVGGAGSTGGVGGQQYPNTMPLNWALNNPAFGDGEISVFPPDTSTPNPLTCGVGMVAGPGSGGAYALPGGTGTPLSPYVAVNPGVPAQRAAGHPGRGQLVAEPRAPGHRGRPLPRAPPRVRPGLPARWLRRRRRRRLDLRHEEQQQQRPVRRGRRAPLPLLRPQRRRRRRWRRRAPARRGAPHLDGRLDRLQRG